MNLDIIFAIYRFYTRVYYETRNHVGWRIDFSKNSQKWIVSL